MVSLLQAILLEKSLVVWGIKDGRDAAKNIKEYIEFKQFSENREKKKVANA